MKMNNSLSLADYITLSNGLLGFLAITYVIDEIYYLASIILIICIGLDGLDGYVARRMNVVHKFGSYLDMVSDMISFCFAPAMLVYSTYYDINLGRAWESPLNALATFVPMAIVFFGVLRLSRFADINHKNVSYSGLPTPLLTLFIICITYLFGWGAFYELSPYSILIIILGLSILLYSKFSYPKIRRKLDTFGGLIVLFMVFFGFISSYYKYGLGNILISVTLLICIIYILIGPILVDKYG